MESSHSTVTITGAHGLLGTQLQPYFPNALCPTHKELDITEPWLAWSQVWPKQQTIIHCAAVKTVECDKSPRNAMNVNIVGTAEMTDMCHITKSKMVYISTDYVFKGDRGNYAPDDAVSPQNYYAETKLAGEYIVKSLPKEQYLIIRLSFFPNEWPYEGAFTDQWTTRVPVSRAAEEITSLIKSEAIGVQHICGPKQTVYDYALSTANGKEIKPMLLSDCDGNYKRPRDTSLVHGDNRNTD